MKQAIIHEYYASSPGINWNLLVSEAIRDARRTHQDKPDLTWKLEGMYEYDREVYDDKGRLIDLEARVVVRGV